MQPSTAQLGERQRQAALALVQINIRVWLNRLSREAGKRNNARRHRRHDNRWLRGERLRLDLVTPEPFWPKATATVHAMYLALTLILEVYWRLDWISDGYRGIVSHCQTRLYRLFLSAECRLAAALQKGLGVEFAEDIDQAGDDPGPTRLMASADPSAVIAVEIFVE
jgi:hypothetical protein